MGPYKMCKNNQILPSSLAIFPRGLLHARVIWFPRRFQLPRFSHTQLPRKKSCWIQPVQGIPWRSHSCAILFMFILFSAKIMSNNRLAPLGVGAPSRKSWTATESNKLIHKSQQNVRTLKTLRQKDFLQTKCY